MRSKKRKAYIPDQDRTSTGFSSKAQTSPEFSTERQQHSRQKNTVKLLYNNHQPQEYQSQQMKLLVKENSQLKRQLIQLKVHQFYHFDDNKLKTLMAEVQTLKKELKTAKAQITQLQLHNDFLTRANAQLKIQLQKTIQQRKKEEKNIPPRRKAPITSEDYKMDFKVGFCKSIDYTRNTDTSRNIQDSHYTVYHTTNFQLQNTTLEDVFECKDSEKPREKSRASRNEQAQVRSIGRGLMNKIANQRKGKEGSVQRGKEGFWVLGKKQKSPVLQQKC